jgi:hypothetical protein
MRRRPITAAAAGLVLLTGTAVACSSSSGSSGTSSAPPLSSSSAPSSSAAQESAPPGDIPDTQAYVSWSPSAGGFTVKVPEGWSRTTQGSATVFADKFNSIRIDSLTAAKAPTAQSVRSTDLPAIQGKSTGFALRQVTVVQRKGGSPVMAEYLADSAPDQVTGKSVQLDVQRYAFFKSGKETVLTLSGAVNADNVDPWKIVTDSFRWS